jgi:hypothetical protein
MVRHEEEVARKIQQIKNRRMSMALIGEKAKKEILNQIERMLDTYLSAIDAAYGKADGPLSVPFKVQLSPGKDIGSVRIKTEVSFNLAKVKDEAIGWVTEQPTLPGM